jgi:hypothetical protein
MPNEDRLVEVPMLLWVGTTLATLLVALVPCIAANLGLRRWVGIGWPWLAAAAVIVVGVPRVLELTGHGFGTRLFHWFL